MTAAQTFTEWALEGAPIHECHRIPGRLYPSCPTFDTLDEAEDVQDSVWRRTGPPLVRILRRETTTDEHGRRTGLTEWEVWR